jgi:hypothetical protein
MANLRSTHKWNTVRHTNGMKCAVLIAALAAAGALGQAVAATPKATLRLIDDTTPVTLHGSGFQPREHVRIAVVSGTTQSMRRTVATRLGRFVVKLESIDVNSCTGLSIRALGSDGTKATLKRLPGQCALP